jgi:hypothetical protein
MATEPKTRDEFDTALANGDQVILVVMGDGGGFDEIVNNADRAILLPETQAVVWLRDTAILTSDEKKEYGPGDPKYVACALSRPPRRVSAQVSRPLAMTMIFMQALSAAQNRPQPPVVF